PQNEKFMYTNGMSHQSLKFAPHLIQSILTGKKTATWRLFNDKDLKAGEVIDLIQRPELKVFAKAKIRSIEEKPLGRLTQSDWEGHERFSSDEEMYKTYESYYNRPVNADTIVTIIRFQLL